MPYYPLALDVSSCPAAGNSSQSQLDAIGAKAIALCKPTNAVVNLGTFLGEFLKDGLPRLPLDLWREGTQGILKRGADDYLNVQFGYLPVFNDIARFVEQVKHVDTVVKQFERDSGRLVRRRFHFPSRNDVSFVSGPPSRGYCSPSMDNPCYNGTLPSSTPTNLQQIRRQSRWFAGGFTYYLPNDWTSHKGIGGMVTSVDKAFDARLTPETLWNLAPWSWAVDWFSNVGDVLNNISDWATYDLVMRYGYMMEHSINTDIYTLAKQAIFSDAKLRADCSISLVTETKMRRRANPFGFGLSWNSLSKFQLSIAAALGISKR